MTDKARPRRPAAGAAAKRRRRAAASGAAALGAAIAGSPAQAAEFLVTNLADSGPGSLRQAIDDANGAAGADTIVFQDGLAGTIQLTSGQLEVHDSLAIEGPGPDVLTVAGPGIEADPASRVFYLYDGDALLDVSISGLTITGGNAFSDSFAMGGGVSSWGENLTLRDVVVSGNVAAIGGGVAVYAGDLTIQNSVVSANLAFLGGGVAAYEGSQVGVQDSEIAGNAGFLVGGGGAFYRADVTMERSTIADNVALVVGGGLAIGGIGPGCECGPGDRGRATGAAQTTRRSRAAALAPALVAALRQTAGGAVAGGGAVAWGEGAARRAGRAGTATGPGPRRRTAAGEQVSPTTLTLRATTVSGNLAGADADDPPPWFDEGGELPAVPAIGGGIYLYGAEALLDNTTVSGNRVLGVDEGGEVFGGLGGGIAFYGYVAGQLALRHTTVTANHADGIGAGVFAIGSVAVVNSILAENTAGDPPEAQDLFVPTDAPSTAAYSLIGEYDGNLTDAGGNVFAEPALLGPLADNGGPTQTHLPAAVSLAVDAGSGASTPDITADQRGFARPAGTEVDMGAVERDNGVVQFTITSVEVSEDDGTATLTVARSGPNDGPAAVDYQTADGTATAPADYLAAAGTLCWEAGDGSPKTIEVTINPDGIFDPGETFTVVLANAREEACGGALVAAVSSPGGPRLIRARATLGPNDVATVTILEGTALAEVPTAGEYAQLLLAALLGGAGVWLARRRAATVEMTVRRRR